MILIICADDKLGMAFNRRRQSMDSVLRQKLLQYCGTKKIWMSPYTATQFNYNLGAGNIEVSDEFLSLAGENEYCFVETNDIVPFADKIQEIILFRWNRTYPADTFLKIPGHISDWHISVIDEFPGKSHKKITMESWRKEK